MNKNLTYAAFAAVTLILAACGAKEEEEGTVSVRSRDTGETVSMPLEAFVEKVTSEIKSRTR